MADAARQAAMQCTVLAHLGRCCRMGALRDPAMSAMRHGIPQDVRSWYQLVPRRPCCHAEVCGNGGGLSSLGLAVEEHPGS